MSLPKDVLPLLLLVASGCTCTKGNSVDSSSDSAVSDTAVDLRSDARDQGGERPLWLEDIGPVPDANTALCTDAWFPDGKPTLDAKASLTVKPAVKFKTLLAKASESQESAPVLGPDGTIHILTQHGIFGVAPAGQVKWSVAPPGSISGFGGDPMTINGQWLVYGSSSGINGLGRTGAGKWFVPFKGPIDPLAPPGSGMTSAPVLDGKGNVLIAGPDNLLYRIDDKGKLLGTSTLPGRAWGSWHPLVDGHGNAYFGILGAVVRVVSVTAGGKLRWDRKVLPSTSLGGPPTMTFGRNGDLLVASGEYIWQKPPLHGFTRSYVVSLDPGCGAERWRSPTVNEDIGSILVGPDGNLFFRSGTMDTPDKLVSLTSRGQPRWSTALENSSGSGHLVIYFVGPLGADGVIYTLISNEGKKDDPSGPPQVRAYSMADGKELWKLPIEWMQIGSSYPLLRTDGMLIFGASFPYDPMPGLYLLGVQTPSPGMPVAPWPRTRHDNQSSGNISTKLP